MCSYHVGWGPKVPNYGRGMGLAVVEGQPFGNTHAGPTSGVAARHLNYSDYLYPPVPPSNDAYIPLEEHKKNICQTFIREDLAINAVTYADPAIYAQLVTIAAFLTVCFLANKKVLACLHLPADCNLRERRNAVVYVGQLIFSTLVLPILCRDLGNMFTEESHLEAVDPNQYVLSRGIMMTQAMLYLLELFYRIDIRLSLVGHHLMTSLTVIYLNFVVIQSFQFLAVKFGMVLILLAVTEQPLYIVLLLRIVRSTEKMTAAVWSRLCYLASAAFLASRVVVVVLLIVLLTEQSKSTDIAWDFLERSFVDWHTSSSSWVSNPTKFNITLLLLLLGILLSNVFAVKAMFHMAKRSPELKEEFKEDDGGDDTSEELDTSLMPTKDPPDDVSV